MIDIFISYSRRDSGFAETLHAELTARNRKCWVDWEGIPPSAEWLREIHAAIDSAEAFVFVISPDSVASEVCRAELRYAAGRKKRLIPIVCRESAAVVPEEIAGVNWLFFRADDFAVAVDRLVDTLATDLDWVKLHTRLLVRAQQWVDQARDRGSLLSGRDLQEAERWLIAPAAADTKREVSPLHTEYIVSSRQSVSRRQRLLLVGVSVALIATIVLGLLAWYQRNAAFSRELVAVAREQLPIDPVLAGLLAREAIGSQATAEAQDAVRQTALTLRKQRWLGRQVTRAEIGFSSDGTTVHAISMSEVTVWDRLTGSLLERWPLPPERPSVLLDHGRVVATPNGEGAVRLWDLGSGATIRELKVTRGGVDPSADGRRIAITRFDPLVTVWDTATGQHLFDLRSQHAVVTATFSPDDQVIGTSADGGPVELWDGSSGRFLCSVPESAGDRIATFSPDSLTVVTHGGEPVARSWSIHGCRAQATFAGHASLVISAEFSADGDYLVTASDDHTARIWRARTGELLTMLRGHSEPVQQARFSHNGELVATVSDDRTARVWERASGNTIATLKGHLDRVERVAFGPSGDELVTSDANGVLRMWDYRVPDGPVALSGHTGRVQAIAFSADSTRVLTSGDDKTARVWLAATGAQMALHTFRDFVTDTAFSPDGTIVATASRGQPILLWNATTGAVVAELSGHTKDVSSVGFSPDGRYVASGSDDATTRIWDVAKATGRFELRHKGPVTQVEFSPDSQYLATASYDPHLDSHEPVRVFRTESGQPVATIEGRFSARTLRFSADGRLLLVAGDDGVARILETQEWTLQAALAGHVGTLTDADFTRDGSQVLTMGLDQTVRLWNVADATQRAVLRGHINTLKSGRFSADARVVASAGDVTVRLWNATTGEALLTLTRTNDFINQVAFSPDGTMLGVATSDRVALVYPFELFALIDDVRPRLDTRLIRSLTQMERRQYLHEWQPLARFKEWFDGVFGFPDISS